MRYTADYVREQLFAPPFQKVPAKERAKEKKASVNITSRNLCRVRNMTSACNNISGSCSATHIEVLNPCAFLGPVSGRFVQEIYASCNKISGDRHEFNAWH